MKFDESKLTRTLTLIKSIGISAYGGVKYLDTTTNKVMTCESDHKINRTLLTAYNKQSDFIVPVEVNVIRYDGVVVAFEPLTFGLVGRTIENIVECVNSLSQHGEVLFDGQAIYVVPPQNTETVLSSDGKIVMVDTHCAFLNVQLLTPTIVTGRLIGYKTGGKTYYSGVISTSTYNTLSLNQTETAYAIDKMDAHFRVNLLALMSTARAINATFGQDKIEFLDLYALIQHYKTVNLSAIQSTIQRNIRTNHTNSSLLVWLIGLNQDAVNVHQVRAIRSSLAMIYKGSLSVRQQVPFVKDNKGAGDVKDAIKLSSCTFA